MHPALANPFDQNSVSPVGENSSDGSTESRRAKTGNKTGSIPVEARCPTASSFAREEVRGAAIQPCAGVAPGPSDRFILDEQAFMDAIEPPPLFLQPGYKFARRVS